MKAKLFCIAITLFLIFFKNSAQAQFCFWIANKSSITFNEVKVRVSGSGEPFSRDLLPYDYLKNNQYCWIRTSSSEQIWDVQITRLSGSPILFSYTDVGGDWHSNQRYITVNARLLHTLVIGENNDGSLNFSYYTTDELDLGHPCDN